MKLNNIFSSHMVFAYGLPIRIYGTGKGEAKITFANQTKTILSNTEKWCVEFSPMKYGGPYDLIFCSNNKSVILTDIYVGEVYLFSGQSNMQFKMKESTTDISAYETIDKLRIFSTDRIEKTDIYTAKDKWFVCEKEKVENLSAIAYLTSREIVKLKNIAIGIITCYQGASVIESWVPKGTFEKNGINIPINQKFKDHTCEKYAEWNSDGKLYSYALSQVIPFSISAVIWYQGESDASFEEAKVYKQELSLLIQTWRNDFNNSALPFIIIQIADNDKRQNEAWKTIQNAQYEIQNTLSNVKTVISRDVCEKNNIHPPTKDLLSKRVACTLNELFRCNGFK